LGRNGGIVSENDVATIIVDSAMAVHTATGPGLLESVYEVILAHELKKRGLSVERQVPIPIIYENLRFEEGFRADLIVEDVVVVEAKSVEALLPVHSKQVLTYLRLTNRRLGLLINFGEAYLRNGIKRLVNGLPEEGPKL
jgi:GxxExxY protein